MKRNQGFLEKWLLPNQEQEVHKISLLDNKEAIKYYWDNAKQNNTKQHIATLKGPSLAKNG